MASSNRVSWEKDIRDSIRTNFGAGWRVNGENSGKTKILYVYQEGLGKGNKREDQAAKKDGGTVDWNYLLTRMD